MPTNVRTTKKIFTTRTVGNIEINPVSVDLIAPEILEKRESTLVYQKLMEEFDMFENLVDDLPPQEELCLEELDIRATEIRHDLQQNVMNALQRFGDRFENRLAEQEKKQQRRQRIFRKKRRIWLKKRKMRLKRKHLV